MRRALERTSSARDFVRIILHAMKNDARWIAMWAWRVLANALVGGFATAMVGALCGGAVGSFITFVISLLLGEFGIDMIFGKLTVFGATLGLASGIVGLFIFAIAAWRATPNHFLMPFRELKRRVFLGQALATLLVCASFVVFEFLKSNLQNISFAAQLINEGHYLLVGAPILMICGAIAGALSKRDWPKVATLKSR